MTATIGHQFAHKTSAPSLLELTSSEKSSSVSLVTLTSLQSVDKYRVRRPDKKTYKSGAWYVGRLDGTQRIGWGQFNWVNGGCYDGNYVDNKRHGDGKYTWSDGSVYIGSFQNDLRHGFGEQTWTSGERYTGQFYEDMRHGTGSYTWMDGTQYSGNFRHNCKCGFGVLTYPNGDTFEGIYKEDQRNGAGVYTHAEDGTQDVGLWRGNTLIRLCSVAEGSFVFDHMCDHFINAGGNISPNLKTLNKDILLKPSTPGGGERGGSGGDKSGSGSVECEFTAPNHFPYKLINEGIRKLPSKKGCLENLSEKFLNVVAAGDLNAVKQITQTGLINVNVSDKTGFFGLLAASVNCHVKVINYLLDSGANMNQLTDEGLSCLSACHILLYASQNYVDNIAENVAKENLFNSVELDKKSGSVINRNERKLILAIYEEIYKPFGEKRAENTSDVGSMKTRRQSTVVDDFMSRGTSSVDGEERVGRFDPWKLDFYQRSMDRVKEVEEINRTFKDIMLNPHKMSASNVEYIDLVSLPTRHVRSSTPTDDGYYKTTNNLMDNPLHTTVASILGYGGVTTANDDDKKSRQKSSKTNERFNSAANNDKVSKMINSERRPHLLSTVDLLLSRGASPSVSTLPMPVLFFAVKSADPVAVAKLLQCRADTSARLDHLKLCALHIAAALPGSEGLQITELLLKHGADANARDGYLEDDIELGRTPLHIACSREDDYKEARSVVLLLLSYGANPNLHCFGNAPLTLAIASGNDLVVDTLIQHGADVSLKLSHGLGSILCCATSFQAERRRTPVKRMELVEKLIAAGADMLMPICLSNKLPPGTVMDYAYHVYYQDRRISCTPYHALSSLERECYNARKEMLEKLACHFRVSVAAKEKQLEEELANCPDAARKTADAADARKKERGTRKEMRHYNLERMDDCGLGYMTLKRGKRTEETKTRRRYRYCNECGRSIGVRLAPCPRCKEIFYCSKNCKIKLWNSRHREECAKVTGSAPMETTAVSADTVKAVTETRKRAPGRHISVNRTGNHDTSTPHTRRNSSSNKEDLGFLPHI